MIGKSVYFLAFVVSIAAIVNAAPDRNFGSDAVKANLSHDLIIGTQVPGDRLVLRQNVVKASSWLQIGTLDQLFNVSDFGRITQVRALDQKTNGKGATASRVTGGPGTGDVTLHFESIRGHSINFVVEIYAKA